METNSSINTITVPSLTGKLFTVEVLQVFVRVCVCMGVFVCVCVCLSVRLCECVCEFLEYGCDEYSHDLLCDVILFLICFSLE